MTATQNTIFLMKLKISNLFLNCSILVRNENILYPIVLVSI